MEIDDDEQPLKVSDTLGIQKEISQADTATNLADPIVLVIDEVIISPTNAIPDIPLDQSDEPTTNGLPALPAKPDELKAIVNGIDASTTGANTSKIFDPNLPSYNEAPTVDESVLADGTTEATDMIATATDGESKGEAFKTSPKKDWSNLFLK